MPTAPDQKPPIHATVEELLDQLRGAWRFKWVALFVAWGVAIALWTVIFLIPNTYEAKARVFVDTGTTLSQATRGIGLADNVENQIERVREAILGTPELQKVANGTNLMAGALTSAQQQLVIDKLRKNLDITGQFAPGRGSAALFTITYKDPDRARAVQVVNTLLNTFVEGTLLDKNQGSQEAVQFLNQQISQYGQKLSATEQKLANFKKRNIGLLPSDQGDYFTRLQSDQQSLTTLRQNLFVAQREGDALARELHTGQQYTTGGPTSAPLSGAALDTEQQIQQDEQRLAQMLLQYTDKYPDVIALRETLKELKTREKKQMAAAQHGDVSAASALGLTANPVYQRLEEKYNAQQVTIASLQQQIADQRQRIAQLKAQMQVAPQVQAQYADLMRNYTVTKKQYNALLGRLDSTRLGQQAASTGTVKFQVIDPPMAQYTPVAPKRPRLIIVSLIAALGAGLGVAYLLHLLQPTFVSTRQLGAVTGLTVLGAVSMAWAGARRAERHRSMVLYACGTVGLVLLGLAVLVLNTHISNLVGDLRT